MDRCDPSAGPVNAKPVHAVKWTVDTSGPAVDDPDDVTSQWMTRALSGAGENIEVCGLRYERVGTGQIGASYRFWLDYAIGGQTVTGPDTVIVKMATGDASRRDMVSGGYRNEVGFYTTFAGQAMIRTPHCWHASITADNRQFTLVLEDAAPARVGSQDAGCSAVEAEAALRNLAGLHAPFWNVPGLGESAPWVGKTDDAAADFLGEIHGVATGQFIDRYRQELSAEDSKTLAATAEVMSAWIRGCRSPFSLIHGDYRLDNLMFSSSPARVTTVDWQTLAVGFPGRDVAYFLSTAISPSARRRDERALVGAYHDQLVDHGVTDYSFATCFADYRRGALQGPLTTVLGCIYATGERSAASDRMFLSMARYSCQAIRDLGTIDEVLAADF